MREKIICTYLSEILFILFFNVQSISEHVVYNFMRLHHYNYFLYLYYYFYTFYYNYFWHFQSVYGNYFWPTRFFKEKL